MSPSDESTTHYWHPVPEPDGRRHAFRGSRGWDGSLNARTTCGRTVPMAVASELDWIHRPTCPHCWDVLTTEVVTEFDSRFDET